MDKEQLATPLAESYNRRRIVKTGVALAYAAPLVAASFKLSGRTALAAAPRTNDDPCGDDTEITKINIGGATVGTEICNAAGTFCVKVTATKVGEPNEVLCVEVSKGSGYDYAVLKYDGQPFLIDASTPYCVAPAPDGKLYALSFVAFCDGGPVINPLSV